MENREWMDIADEMFREEAKKSNEEYRRLHPSNHLSSMPTGKSEKSKFTPIDGGLILKVVSIVCVTWIICSLINSCTNRYYAIAPNQQILDKHSGEIFRPGAYPTRQAFGEKLERIAE